MKGNAMDLLKRFARGIRFDKGKAGPRWRTPVNMDRGNLGEACLALDGNSQGTALWENGGRLWTMPIGPMTAPALMRLPLGEGATPRLVMNSDGRGIALWQIVVEGERQLLGKILGSGDSLANVVFRTQGRVSHLQAAVDRRGNALVVWLHEVEGRFEVMAKSFDTRGLAWEQEPTTLSKLATNAVEPRIAVNHREHAMVLWEVQDSGSESLVASHYWPTDRIWSDRPVPVVSHATRHHQVVMDDFGNALALWINAPYGQRTTLEASFYDGQRSEWGEPEVLGNAHFFSPPQLAMSGAGEALAVWSQGEDHGAPRLFAKAFKKGKWEADVECLDLGREPVLDFAIALGSEGQAGLLAVHQRPEGDWVSARLRQPRWSPPVQLGPVSQLPLSCPRLRLCPRGGSALWMQGEGKEKALILCETT
jgi:hypothetical protein